MNHYYQEVSFNKTRITGNILRNWVDIPKNMSYYGNYSNNNHSLGSRKLIEDAIRIVDDTVDFSLYRFIMVVHVGNDEARSGNETNIWSWGWWSGLGLSTGDGAVFQQGAVVSEEDLLGMFCHEFGHVLGLPDLYNENKSAVKDFVGPWDLMGKGSWNNNGTHPSHPLSWSKIKLGWIDPTQILIVNNRNTIVRAEPLERLITGIMAVKIPVVSPNVYYLIEVRKRILYDHYLPNEGVLVTLVNETKESGKGIVTVMDAMNLSRSLENATFKDSIDGNAVFLDAGIDLGVVVLKEVNNSYEIHITSFLNGKIAKEANEAIRLAQAQIDVQKDSKIEFLQFTVSKIDLSKAIEMLQKARTEFQNREYLQSIKAADQATFQAIASELHLRSEERDLYFSLLIFALMVGITLLIISRLKRRKYHRLDRVFNIEN